MQLRRLLLLLLAVLCATRVAAQTLPPRDVADQSASADTGTIRGRIIAGDTRKPIFRAAAVLDIKS